MHRAVIVLALVAGCSSKAKTQDWAAEHAKLVETNKPLVEARYAAWKKLGETVKAIPPVTAREPVTTKESASSISWIQIENVYDIRNGSGRLNLRNLTIAATADAALTAKPADKSKFEEARSTIEAFVEPLGVLAIVRAHELAMPKMSGPDRFVAGVARGDVLLFDFATQTKVGAFPFDIAMGDIAYGASNVGDLQDQFHRKSRDGLDAELAAYLAGEPGPAAPRTTPDTPEALRKRQLDDVLLGRMVTFEIVEEPCTLTLVTKLAASVTNPDGPFDKVDAKLAAELVRVMGKPCDVAFRVQP